MATQDPLETAVTWSATSNPAVPWRAQVDDQIWTVRLNDSPEEHLYALMIGHKEVQAFDDWPPLWQTMESQAKRAPRPPAAPAPNRRDAQRPASRERKSRS